MYHLHGNHPFGHPNSHPQPQPQPHGLPPMVPAPPLISLPTGDMIPSHDPQQLLHLHHQQQHQHQQLQLQQHHHFQVQQHSRRRQHQVLTFIRRFGKRAGFPIPTLAAAQLLFHITTLHGMHASVSQAQALVTGQSLLAQAPLLDAACACLLVAGKAMDTAKKLRDLLTRAYAYHHRGEQQLDPDSDKFARWRAKIVLLEREVLESIQFRYNLPLPFDFLIRSCKKAACPKPLAFRAYQLLYDLYQCKVVIEYPPHVLALTAVFLATRTFHVTDGGHAAASQDLPNVTTVDSPDVPASSTGHTTPLSTSSVPPPAAPTHAPSSLLTPASPEDVALTLLPPALRDVLDSFHEHVHAAALQALDFLIPMTPTESPLYEAYRSIKIELNQLLGIGAATAPSQPAPLAAPAPHTVPVPAPAGVPGGVREGGSRPVARGATTTGSTPAARGTSPRRRGDHDSGNNGAAGDLDRHTRRDAKPAPPRRDVKTATGDARVEAPAGRARRTSATTGAQARQYRPAGDAAAREGGSAAARDRDAYRDRERDRDRDRERERERERGPPSSKRARRASAGEQYHQHHHHQHRR